MDHHRNMDSSSTTTTTHQNWLAFSLSNNHHSLFQPNSTLLFNSNNPCTTHSSGGDQEINNGGGGACTTNDRQLTVLCGGGGEPKLEDFLGVSGGGPSDEGIMVNVPNHVGMYGDSELKTIAAGFLRGFSTHEQSDDVAGKQLAVVVAPPPPVTPAKKAVETFGQRTSIFRGVTRHRWTGRYEAHLWDNSCRREGQSRKGRQVYLGGYDKEEKAARAYDLAALKYWGPTTTTNFPVLDYEKELEEMKHMTRQEFVASLRRKSSGFSRGASMYRGVTRHHQHGRWQARIGRVAGNKDLYLGTFSTQEEAAEAYDIAAIKFRGLNAVTNFDMTRYDVKSIASSNLPIGGATNKPKTSSESISDNKSLDAIQPSDHDPTNKDSTSATSAPFPSQNSSPTINFGVPIKQDQSSSLWAALGYQNPTLTSTTSRNPNSGITLFQDGTTLQGTAPYSTDFPSNEGFYNGGGYYDQQQTANGTTDGSNGTTEDELAYGNGNWVFQTAKPNISTFQTPIFGIE